MIYIIKTFNPTVKFEKYILSKTLLKCVTLT